MGLKQVPGDKSETALFSSPSYADACRKISVWLHHEIVSDTIRRPEWPGPAGITTYKAHFLWATENARR